MTGPATPEMRAAFGRALDEAMAENDIKPPALADAAAVTPDAVRKWMAGLREPEPQTVFVLEETLRLVPGELSRHFGYVPVGAHVSLLAAIDAAEELTDRDRKVLRATYRSLRS